MDNTSATAALLDAAALAGMAERGLGTDPGMPILQIGVFGRFEMSLDGRPLVDPNLRGRRLKTLVGILALNHGHELYCDYLADSIWPDSSPHKQRNSFYNLWYKLNRYALPEGVDKACYFERHQYSCRLADEYVVTDVQEVERACSVLLNRESSPMRTIEAYRHLQRAYSGELLPGEVGNAIILRSREEWRSRVSESLYLAAKRLKAQGELTGALWLAEAACRVDGMREDFVRLRMRLLIDLGRPSAALRAFDDMRRQLMREVGVGPSRESSELVREVVEAIPIDSRSPIRPKPRRRGVGKPAVRPKQRRERVELGC